MYGQANWVEGNPNDKSLSESRKIIREARRTGDVHTLETIMESGSAVIADEAAVGLYSAVPSKELLSRFESMITSGTDEMREERGIRGVYFLATSLGMPPVVSGMPELPSKKEFEARPDYWVALWRKWFVSRGPQLLGMIAARPHATPSAGKTNGN